MTNNPFIISQSAISNLKPEDTINLLEKVNNFVKQKFGYFNLTITPAHVEVRYTNANGPVTVVVGDSLAAVSDAVLDVMNRAQSVHQLIDEAIAEAHQKNKDELVQSGTVGVH